MSWTGSYLCSLIALVGAVVAALLTIPSTVGACYSWRHPINEDAILDRINRASCTCGSAVIGLTALVAVCVFMGTWYQESHRHLLHSTAAGGPSSDTSHSAVTVSVVGDKEAGAGAGGSGGGQGVEV